MGTTSYVGRQPVFDAGLQLAAFELLFRARADSTDAEPLPAGPQATAGVLVDSIFNIGLEQLIEDKPAFVNVSRDYLVGAAPLPFGPDRFILEILEDIALDAELLGALETLRAKGFRLALDDIERWHPDIVEVLPLIEFVKLDVLAIAEAELPLLVQQLRAFPLTLIAEKVETWDMLDRCKALGFDLFQGYFLEKPKIVEGSKIPHNRMALLQTLSKLQDPSCEFEDLQAVIGTDPGLSLKLLRLANSAMYGLRKKIESLQQVVIFLGLDTIKQWTCLILLSQYSNKPRILTSLALMRARLCQQMCAARGMTALSSQAFTVGLFSVLDALMDQPLAVVLDSVQLDEVLRGALLEREGPLGETLSAVLALEHGQWEIAQLMLGPKADPEPVWLDALKWTHGLMSELGKAA
ncbi:MAG TPA: HDOD domain-containing protein [Arenimonas sp.]|nr:HDOD domain-containing protein [Arenimonas sp.]